MIKILFQIKDNKLYAKIRYRLNTDQKSLINTNVISQNELVFSDEYIASNIQLIHNFLKELILSYNIDTLIIRESSIAPLVIHVASHIPSLTNLYLLEESIVSYKIVEKIIKSNNIKYVSLYNIPSYLMEMLDEKGVKVSSRNEILFMSNFMKYNNLENFSSLYYKTSIKVNLPFSKEDEDDFLAFININKYLKTIYINTLNKNDVENILEILYTYRLKKIKIYIEQNINDIELIEYLKKINKKNAKINGIQFKIDYSEEYLEDNLMGQIHINTVKACIFIALFIVSSLVVYVFGSNYNSMQKVEDIQEDIQNAIISYEEKVNEESTEEPTPPEVIVTPDDVEEPKVPEKPKEEKKLKNDMAALLEMNEDTVGWLKVNNTNVDYPVVQAEDNDYYLKKNFNRKNDASGWIFMDYRANATDLSQNTIIFGHNMYYSGVMFGTLYKTKYPNWYTKEENQIIEFDTLYENHKWQIFSIYTVPSTNDYLIANFSTDEKYQDFINLITKRSIYTFNTPVSVNDKILTLSTCSNNGTKRLVIHAVLLDEKTD